MSRAFVFQSATTPVLGFPAASLAVTVRLLVVSAVRLTLSVNAPLASDVPLAVAAPPVGFVLLVGNASLLWMVALLCALSLLARERPRSAGAMIALLTLKPQPR